jgi:large subunit ribosomal protein L17e
LWEIELRTFLQVMLTKDYTKWNFDMLQEFVEGPLLNPKRMEEAIKVSKFIRRLMSFFHPFSHRFSDITNHKVRPTSSADTNINDEA